MAGLVPAIYELPHTPCRFSGCPTRGGARPGMAIKLSLNDLTEAEH
jgi:hypothetical protein